VEAEVRNDIERYEEKGLTPIDFAPLIQTHSTLAITSPLKMRYAVTAKMQFDGNTKQTTYFETDDVYWLEQNIGATRQLLTFAEQHSAPETVWGRHIVYRDLSVDLVLDFLRQYQIHEKHKDMPRDQLLSYIRAQNESGRLERWNVGVVSRLGHKLGPEWQWTGLLPNQQPITLVNRARMANEEVANIKTLLGKSERALDLGMEPAPNKVPDSVEGNFVRWTANLRSPENDDSVDPAVGRNTPLLLIYPISKDSTSRSSRRKALGSKRHVVGITLLFPSTQHNTPQDYITADLSSVDEDILPDPVEDLGVEQ